MRKSRFTETQIMGILRQVEGGTGLAEARREHAISSATFYKWRLKYGGMDASDAKKPRAPCVGEKMGKFAECRQRFAKSSDF